jgi:Transcription factor AFT
MQTGDALLQLQSMTFMSFEDLYREVKARGRAIGFRIGIRRSIRKPGNTEACRYYLECDRGRRPEPRGQGKRSSSSRKEDCPWSAKAVYSKSLNQWVLTIRNGTHSHQMSRSVEQIPGFRRDDRSMAVLKDIEDLSRQPALTAADIARQIQAAHGVRMLAKDVSNQQQKIREGMLEERTTFQQSHDEPQASSRPRNTGKPTVAQLAQTTAAIQEQLAQVHDTMSGLATAIERLVQATSIFQAQSPLSTRTTPPAPIPEPPRNPLQAVPPSSPGYFDAMRPPNQMQQPIPRTAGAPKGVPRGYAVIRF